MRWSTPPAAWSGPWWAASWSRCSWNTPGSRNSSPRFNVMFRDDKTYPYLAVTMGEKYPRVQVLRGERRKGTRYFGPYTAGAIRDTMDTLLRVFPVRSCSAGVLKRAEASGRPCLLGYIDKCAAPCVGRISAEDHRALAEDFCAFMGGEAKRFVSRLEKDMAAAVAELDYERAARVRDDIVALKKVFERNAVVLAEDTDADVFALHEDELEAAVQVFHVRGGRIRGQRGWVVEKVEDSTTPDLVEHLLQQVYGEEAGSQGRLPREVLVPGRAQQRRRARPVAQRPARGPGGHPRPAARRQGRPALHRPGQRRTRAQAAQVPARRRPDHALPGAAGTAGSAGPAGRADADRMLRHLARPGHQRGRLHGGGRGRPAQEIRLPEVLGHRRRGQRRHGGHARRPDAPLPELPAGTSRQGGRRFRTLAAAQAAAVADAPLTGHHDAGAPDRSSPTRPTSSSSTAASPRSTPPRRPWPNSASTTSTSSGWPSGSRRSGCRTATSRSSCPAPRPASTCCSGSATRPTASPSPSTGKSAARP